MNFSIRYFIGIFLVIVGLGFFFNIDIWRFFWPAVLILLGIRLLSNSENRTFNSSGEESSEETIDDTVIFNELNKKVTSEDFRGGEVTAIFGGGTLDLRDAKMAEGETADLEVTAVFGGMKVVVPEGWLVSSSLVGVFGGFANNTKNRPKKGQETGRLNIKGAAIFGGGEVTN